MNRYPPLPDPQQFQEMSTQWGQEVTGCYLAAEVATVWNYKLLCRAVCLALGQIIPSFCKLTAEVFGLGFPLKRGIVNHCIAAKITFLTLMSNLLSHLTKNKRDGSSALPQASLF